MTKIVQFNIRADGDRLEAGDTLQTIAYQTSENSKYALAKSGANGFCIGDKWLCYVSVYGNSSTVWYSDTTYIIYKSSDGLSWSSKQFDATTKLNDAGYNTSYGLGISCPVLLNNKILFSICSGGGAQVVGSLWYDLDTDAVEIDKYTTYPGLKRFGSDDSRNIYSDQHNAFLIDLDDEEDKKALLITNRDSNSNKPGKGWLYSIDISNPKWISTKRCNSTNLDAQGFYYNKIENRLYQVRGGESVGISWIDYDKFVSEDNAKWSPTIYTKPDLSARDFGSFDIDKFAPRVAFISPYSLNGVGLFLAVAKKETQSNTLPYDQPYCFGLYTITNGNFIITSSKIGSLVESSTNGNVTSTPLFLTKNSEGEILAYFGSGIYTQASEAKGICYLVDTKNKKLIPPEDYAFIRTKPVS